MSHDLKLVGLRAVISNSEVSMTQSQYGKKTAEKYRLHLEPVGRGPNDLNHEKNLTIFIELPCSI